MREIGERDCQRVAVTAAITEDKSRPEDCSVWQGPSSTPVWPNVLSKTESRAIRALVAKRLVDREPARIGVNIHHPDPALAPDLADDDNPLSVGCQPMGALEAIELHR